MAPQAASERFGAFAFLGSPQQFTPAQVFSTMPKVRTLRVSNPHRPKRSRNSRRRSRRQNIAEVLIVPNPKKHRSRRNRSHSRKSHKNPFLGKRRHSMGFRRRRHSSRNPAIAGFNTTELIKLALGAGAGVVGSKYLTQLALGSNNAGPMGYAGQAIATLVLGWAAHKWMGKDAATGVVAGGLGALALRIFQENVSGTSTSMQGLGDPDMHAVGVGGGMGDYRSGLSPIPVYGFTAPQLPAGSGGAVQPVAGGPVVMARRRG
jgi:hypothetical protein